MINARLPLALAFAVATVVFLPGTAGVRAAPVATGTIVTVAGNGIDGRTGDGGPATAAAIDHPRGIAFAADGSFLFAEPFTNTVRRVAPDGTITTVAGSGVAGSGGDGGPATAAELRGVHGVAPLPGGSYALVDTGNNRIRRVAPDGTITTIVGTGSPGYFGDGGLALQAHIDNPRGIASLPNGTILIADTENHRIRRVSPDGTITTVAGTGEPGFSGDGGSATAAQLNSPFGVSPTANGGFLIVDRRNQRIRRVAPDGTITTVAGTGTVGMSGDGGPATRAELAEPHNVASLPDGGFLIADTYNDKVRRVRPDGTITTVAGTGKGGFSGDGGPATVAELNLPKALAVLPDLSGFLIGDAANNRVRLVRVILRPFVLRVVSSRLRSRVGRDVRLRYTLSEGAAARLFVVRHSKIVLRAIDRGARGSNRLAFGRGLRQGVYELRLVATTPDGRSARSTATLAVTR